MTDTDTTRDTPTPAQARHLENVAAGYSGFEDRQDVVDRCAAAGWVVRRPEGVQGGPMRRLTDAGIAALGADRVAALRRTGPRPADPVAIGPRTTCRCGCAREDHDADALLADAVCRAAAWCDCTGFRPREGRLARLLDADRLLGRARTAHHRVAEADHTDPAEAAHAADELARIVVDVARAVRDLVALDADRGKPW